MKPSFAKHHAKRPAVIAAVVLAVLAAVAAIGVLLFPRGGGLPVSKEMASFRVAGAGGIVQVDLQRLLHSPWAAASLAEIERRRELPESARKWLAEFLERKGPGRSEITFIELTGGAAGSTSGGVLAIETARPAGREAWEAFLAEFGRPGLKLIETYSGVDIYAEASGGIAFPTDRLTVLGAPSGLKAGIDNLRLGRTGRLDPEVARLAASAPPDSCLVAAFGKTLTDVLARQKTAEVSPSDELRVESGLVWFSAGRELEWFQRAVLEDVEQGRRMREEGRGQLLEIAGKAAPKEDLVFLRDVLAGAKIGGRGRECEMRLELPPTLPADMVHFLRKIFRPPADESEPPSGAP